MKKIVNYILSLFVFILLFPNTVEAKTIASASNIEYYKDFCVETVILDNDTDLNISSIMATNQNTITKTKVSYIKDANNNILWQVSITATFKYDGSSVTCTQCSHSASASASSWTIQNVTSSKNGNSATATATACQKGVGGITHSYTRSVTITCDKNGNVS